jgi:predicted transcriptional regulator
MSPLTDDKLSFNVPPELLGALNQLAASQGRQPQALVDDALREFLERQQRDRPRQHVMSAFASSLDEFDALYKDLAK